MRLHFIRLLCVLGYINIPFAQETESKGNNEENKNTRSVKHRTNKEPNLYLTVTTKGKHKL